MSQSVTSQRLVETGLDALQNTRSEGAVLVTAVLLVFLGSMRAALIVAIFGMVQARYASEHDAKIARKLAHILCGGDLSAPAWVEEQYILDLEREAFLSLAGEPKTLERIQAMLTTGKPLRN